MFERFSSQRNVSDRPWSSGDKHVRFVGSADCAPIPASLEKR